MSEKKEIEVNQLLEDYINDPRREQKLKVIEEKFEKCDHEIEEVDDPAEVELAAGEYLISYVTSRYSRKVHCEKRSWTQCLAALEYYGEIWGEKDGPGVVPAVFGKGPDKKTRVGGKENPDYGKMDTWRQKHCAVDVRWILLDIEDHPLNEDGKSCSEEDIEVWFRTKFGQTKGVVWNSFNHGVEYNAKGDRKWKPGEPRMRVMIPLAAPMSVQEYEIFFELLCDHLDGAVDEGTRDVTRISYAPRKRSPRMRSDVDRFFIEMPGNPFDPADIDFREWGAEFKTLDAVLRNERKKVEEKKQRRQKKIKNLKEAGIKVPSADDAEVCQKALEWLEKAVEKIKGARSGNRNHTVCQQSYWIGTLVGAGMLKWNDAERALKAAAAIVLPQERCEQGEVERAVIGGMEAGARNPYDITNLVGTVDVGDGTTEEGEAYFLEGDEEEICRRILKVVEDERGQPLAVDNLQRWIWDGTMKVWRPVEDKERFRLRRDVLGWNRAPLVQNNGEKIGRLRIRHKDAEHYIETTPAYGSIEYGVDFFGDAWPSISCYNSDGSGRVVIAYNEDVKGLEIRAGDDVAVQVKPRVESERCLDLGGDKPTRFLQCLHEVWQLENDVDQMIRSFQEWVGVTLLGLGPKYETAVVMPGDGDNGKSTILRVVRDMIDEDYVTEVPVQDWNDQKNRFKKTALVGSVINIVEELPERNILESENFKRIVEGQRMQFERKSEQLFWARSKAGHIFAANNLPYTSDQSHGFWKRWMVFPFRYTFSESEIDTAISDKLAEEYDEIFSWFVKGAIRLVKRGVGRTHLIHPEPSDAAKEGWKTNCDPVRQWIDEETVKCDAKEGMQPSEAFEHFKEWSERNRSGERLKSQTFYDRMKALDLKADKRVWCSEAGNSVRKFLIRKKTTKEKRSGLSLLDGLNPDSHGRIEVRERTEISDLIKGLDDQNA